MTDQAAVPATAAPATAAAPTARSSSVVRYDLGRLRGFSDCVFAASITLQAIVAAMPAVGASAQEVDQFLRVEALGYGSYIATFIVVGYVWLQHHRIFGLLRRVDGWQVAANFGLLALVVVLPYFGRLGADFRGLSLPHLVVGVDIAFIGLLLAFVLRRARSAATFAPGVTPKAVSILLWRCRSLAASFGVAALASLVHPGLMGLGWPLQLTAMFVIRHRLGRIEEADVSALDGGAVDGAVDVDADQAPAAVSVRQLDALARITGFSDNVYAFAITVVALQLRLPDLTGVGTNAELISELRTYVDPMLMGYLLGFVVIALFWVAHCRYFLMIERHGTSLPAYNLLHLMTLATLPFVSLLYARFLLPSTTVLYSMVAGFTALSLSALFLYADRNGLTVAGISAAERHRTRLATAAMPIAFFVSVPVAIFSPRWASVVWIVAGLSNRRIIRLREHD